MKASGLLVVLALVGCATAPPPPTAAPVPVPEPALSARSTPFRALGLADALALARQEGKLVLIDFVAAPSDPCRRMDELLWSDAAVRSKLEEQAVAVRLDVAQERELAGSFRIDALPTVLLLAQDGTECDRLEGESSPEGFCRFVDGVVATRAFSARDEVPTYEAIERRSKLADDLADRGEYAQALEQYLWCFDHGERNPYYAGVRLSYLLGDIGELGEVYPQALEAMRQRRDAARAAIGNELKGIRKAHEFVALNRELRESERTLELYRWLKDQGSEMKPVLDMLVMSPDLHEILLEKQLYAEFLEIWWRGAKKLDQRIAACEKQRRRIQPSTMLGKVALESSRESAAEFGAQMHEALLGTGRIEEAEAILGKLTSFEPTGKTYALLIDGARRAGHPDRARAIAREGLERLEGEQEEEVREAAQRID